MSSLPDVSRPSWQCIHFAKPDAIGQIRERCSSDCAVVIDVSEVSCDRDLFEKLASSLHFPDYFGNNWDAVDECLADLEWLPESNSYVVILSGSQKLWTNALETAGKLISAWLVAAESWSEESVGFHLIFA